MSPVAIPAVDKFLSFSVVGAVTDIPPDAIALSSLVSGVVEAAEGHPAATWNEEYVAWAAVGRVCLSHPGLELPGSSLLGGRFR